MNEIYYDQIRWNEDDLRHIREQLESLRRQISPIVYNKYDI